MSHWALDDLIELMNKNVNEMDFPNTIAGRQLHIQNIMLSLTPQSFVMIGYTNHQILESQNAKNSGMDEYVDI